MANTYKSAQVSSGLVRGNWRGSDFTVYGEITAAEAALGDVFQLVQVPNGYRVIEVILDCDQLDSNVTPTLSLEVGDSGAAGLYITGSTVGRTGGVQFQNVAGSTGYHYALAQGGQFAGGNAGATVIQAQVTAAAATFAAGKIRLAARCFLDSTTGEYA